VSPKSRRVTASQVGQYAFCAHAWWLQTVEGEEPINLGTLQAGHAAHERHGWRVSLARGMNRVAWLLLAAGLIALVIWVVGRPG